MGNLPADLHLHSKKCGHAVGELRQYVDRAVELGLEAAGFAFHLPVPIPVDYKVNVTRRELDELVEEVEALRENYAGTIPILLGGEADCLPGQEETVAELTAAYPFDYVLGSVHFLDGWAFDHPAEVGGFEERDVREVYEAYFARLADAMRTGLFDIVGHVDLIKKFGHRPEGDWSDLVEAACRTAGECGLCVELNTAGADKPVGEMYAGPPFVRACKRQGVPICFGSDAHAPGEVGRHFQSAVAVARAAGYERYAYFQRRERTERAL